MNKLFESQWKRTKEALLEGDDLTHNMDGTKNANKRQVMDILLENTRRSLLENATIGATNSSMIAQLNKVVLPVMRRVMPTTIANELVGVQPLTGPYGQIHTLRMRYADTIPSGGGGVTAGDEALQPFSIAKYYSGNENVSAPDGGTTTSLEGKPGNRLSVGITRTFVVAETRKLQARWTFEAAQDALATEITAEIDQNILFSLRRLGGTPASVFDQSAVTGTPTFVGDAMAALAVMINRQANIIASRTRRGAGNWVVVSPTALTILQAATTSSFARSTEGVFEAPTNTKYVGLLNNQMRVYCDQYADDSVPVLVGYKGNETDAAAYYCPYVPLTTTGVMIDPNTTEPVVSFMTRYGYKELSDSSDSLGNAADYVGLVGINASTLSFY
jgi:hypothetical protein